MAKTNPPRNDVPIADQGVFGADKGPVPCRARGSAGDTVDAQVRARFTQGGRKKKSPYATPQTVKRTPPPLLTVDLQTATDAALLAARNRINRALNNRRRAARGLFVLPGELRPAKGPGEVTTDDED